MGAWQIGKHITSSSERPRIAVSTHSQYNQAGGPGRFETHVGYLAEGEIFVNLTCRTIVADRIDEIVIKRYP